MHNKEKPSQSDPFHCPQHKFCWHESLDNTKWLHDFVPSDSLASTLYVKSTRWLTILITHTAPCGPQILCQRGSTVSCRYDWLRYLMWLYAIIMHDISGVDSGIYNGGAQTRLRRKAAAPGSHRRPISAKIRERAPVSSKIREGASRGRPL